MDAMSFPDCMSSLLLHLYRLESNRGLIFSQHFSMPFALQGSPAGSSEANESTFGENSDLAADSGQPTGELGTFAW